MNKQEYLAALKKALKSAGISDCDDIIEEYSEHFDMKTADGFSEEEIAAKLASPEEIAGEYREIGAEAGDAKGGKKGSITGRIFKACGAVLLGMAVYPTLFVLYVWVFTFGIFALTSAITGIFMVSGLGQLMQESPYVHIPPMPYVSSLLLGISLLGLAVLSTAGAEYCRLYVTQMWKKYTRWNKNMLGKGPALPPLPLPPRVTPKKRRVMRTLILISLVVFIIALIAGTATSMIMAQSLEPWHTWGWFQT